MNLWYNSNTDSGEITGRVGYSHSSFVKGGAALDREKYSEIYHALYERAEALGYECAGFEIVNEEGMDIVRLYLEMPGGVDMNDCELVSRALGEYLDTIADDLPERYFLEISSPGLERPLFSPADYKRYLGSDLHILLKKGGRELTGKLISSDDNAAVLETAEGSREIGYDEIKRAHLIFIPKTGQKKTFKKVPKKKK